MLRSEIIEDASVLYESATVVSLNVSRTGMELAEEVQLLPHKVHASHFRKPDKEKPVARAMKIQAAVYSLQSEVLFKDCRAGIENHGKSQHIFMYERLPISPMSAFWQGLLTEFEFLVIFVDLHRAAETESIVMLS